MNPSPATVVLKEFNDKPILWWSLEQGCKARSCKYSCKNNIRFCGGEFSGGGLNPNAIIFCFTFIKEYQ